MKAQVKYKKLSSVNSYKTQRVNLLNVNNEKLMGEMTR